MSQLPSGPVIDLDLNALPDQVPVPPPAIYQFVITQAPEVKPSKEPNKKTGQHSNVVWVSLELDNDGDFKGFQMMDWLAIDSQQGQIRLKRLFMSCGQSLQPPLNLNNLVGARGYCVVSNKPDTSSGRVIMRANLGDYLIPGDQGNPNQKS
jgi:hypothetical protein